MSGAISVESISTQTRPVRVVPDLVRSVLASREGDDVTLAERLLALVRPKRRRSAEDDRPFLVRVMRMERAETVAGLELVHAAADQLGADVMADPRVLALPALALLGAVPLVPVEVEDLHRASGSRGQGRRTGA